MREPRINGPIAWLLLLILGLSPLPFGSEARWAWSLLAVLTGVGMLLWALPAMAGARFAPLPAETRRLLPAGILYAVLLLWIAFQASPWSPAAWHAPAWDAAAGLLSLPLMPAVSIGPAETVGGMARLLAYGGVFFLSAVVAASTERAVRLLRGIVAIALAYAVYGLANELLGLNKVLWYTKWRDLGHVSSTLLDRNAYATLAGLGMCGAMALLFRPKIREGDLSGGWRNAVITCLDYFFARAWRSMSAVGILFAAVVLTHSRTGIAAAIASVIVLVFFVTRKWKNRKPACLAGLAILLAGGAIFLVSAGGVVERIGLTGAAASERGEVYRLTADAIAEAPMPGVGHRGFAGAFAALRSEKLAAPFLHGHNMYLESALELGVVGAAALFAALAWLTALCIRASGRMGRNAALPGLGLGAMTFVIVHSCADSTLRIPAVAVLFAALMGIACARGAPAPAKRGR